jgi:hypothetical protein
MAKALVKSSTIRKKRERKLAADLLSLRTAFPP